MAAGENMHLVREKFDVQHKVKVKVQNNLIIRENPKEKIDLKVIYRVAKSLACKREQTKKKRKSFRARSPIAIPQFFELDKVKIIETGRDLSSFGYMVKDNNFPQAWLALGSWCSYVTEQHNSSKIWSRKM